MIFDFSQSIVAGELITYPEASFVDQPKPNSEIMETIQMRGASTGGNISITGTSDQVEI